MIVVVLAAISIAVASGVYHLFSRDLFRVVIGLTLLGAATNLLVFATGRLASTVPPLLQEGIESQQAAAADPLAQAMVLTAIVISFALLCFALVLGARLRAAVGSVDTECLRSAEPHPEDPVKPPELEW